MSSFRDFITPDPIYDQIYDPIYDRSFDLNYPYTTWNDWPTNDRWPLNTTDRWTDRWGNRDLGTTDRGTRRRVPIQDRIPRHVESRIMAEKEGDVVWRQTNDCFIVHCDLPGVPKEEISIDHRDRELVIQGESKRAATYETATSRVRERNLGRFRKHIYLPRELSGEKPDIEAKYENGLLEIKIPRGKQGSTGRITIN
ncbi:41738_t:CDS:2 [Gigaspora margarita]|uniref:41738_t:CDS:1 n=1 Tax=Gigaspora margarita TaxID=4874 RepID=A0ABN7UJP8_GIGMA|nr:41738_t:CDS:2 [Gigaspora margarita]